MIRSSNATAVRYERDRPGELVHMDVKKIGRIPDGGGWKAHGRAAGNRLSTVGRSSDTVARQGGDEFAILLHDAGHVEATAVAAAVRECFTDPFMLSCGPVKGGGSMGFAIAAPGRSPDHVIQLADDQMYRSKPRSRQGIRLKIPENAT
jgi:diguanylate cyclase (GGDEF)-like protein